MGIKKREVFIVCFIAALILLIGCQPDSGKYQNEQNRDSINAPQESSQSGAKQRGLFGEECEGSGSFKFKTFPLDAEDVEAIIHMGRVQDSHVTPTDHQYIHPKGIKSGSMVTDNPEQYEIRAPADGYIISVELFREPIEEAYKNQEYSDNYLVIIGHSCTFYSEMIHIDTLKPEILSQISFQSPDSQHPFGRGRVPVKEGEVIGTVGARSFDFFITDTEVDLNYIDPGHYSGNFQPWKTHVVDTFDYLEEPLRSQLLKKDIRKVEPYGGKIDFDAEGRLSGNWYLDWNPEKVEEIIREYWTKELSIVYDHIDPSQIRISLGEFGGYPRAHGVAGNAPDPAEISVEDGIIKYELVRFDYYDKDGNKWDAFSYAEGIHAKNSEEAQGVVLLEMIEPRKLKVEVFPYVNPSEVTGFTEDALIYER